MIHFTRTQLFVSCLYYCHARCTGNAPLCICLFHKFARFQQQPLYVVCPEPRATGT
eukprot:m.83328 g.83328  ORF g.83328 m.83328 type:complete len:56 (-) comp12719_c0_seq1:94-261(-)